MNTPPIDIPARLVETLRAAETIAVLTGAGISAESGLSTFRFSVGTSGVVIRTIF